jgi:arginyl-tRNA synthetase
VENGDLAVPVPDEVVVERPKSKDHGDYATNVALQLAKPAGMPPRQVAELVAARLREADGVESVEIAGPGFLNIRLVGAALGELARQVVAAGSSYGNNDQAAGQDINLEFVSANPTGPIHIGHTRWAAVGDALGRLLEASGASVTREFYVNDAGVQVDRFAESLYAAATGTPVPENGYGGEYVADWAKLVLEREPGLLSLPAEEAVARFRAVGLEVALAEIRASLEGFGVHFDVWFSEASLADSGAIERALATLREQGHVFEADGAVWLRTTDFGDDKDRVLIKSDGLGTYFLSDSAYYVDKRARKFAPCIYMLGADHAGYVGRLKALAACAGDDPDQTIEVLIGQLVNLIKDGQPFRMSKRAGNVLALEDLVDAIGKDAARYALARASTDSTLDLDIDVWARQTSDNPVFYVQYAATRAASVLRNARELGLEVSTDADVSLLTHEREQDLLLALAEFPAVVAAAASLREPHRVARYLEEKVAKSAQRFWDECQVLPKGDEPVAPTTAPRLLLWQATRVVLENGLGLLGVSAPERM